jgi:uncharacterized membrane protein YkvA (DUF1232 family)
MSRSRPAIGWFRGVALYYRDPSASVLGKLVMLFALVYVVLPVDLIPDVPIIGWLDDLGVMGLATLWLTRVAARYRALPNPADASVSNSEPPNRGPERPSRRPFSVSP